MDIRGKLPILDPTLDAVEGNMSPIEKEIQRDKLIKTLSELLKQKWVIDADRVINIKQSCEREKADDPN